MIRAFLIMIAIVVFALGLRRVTNALAQKRRRHHIHQARTHFQTTTRCARCGVYLAPGVGRHTADGVVCDTPDCRKACINKSDQ